MPKNQRNRNNQMKIRKLLVLGRENRSKLQGIQRDIEAYSEIRVAVAGEGQRAASGTKNSSNRNVMSNDRESCYH